MQILEQKIFKMYPPSDFSASRFGHAGCLGLAVEPKYGIKSNFKMRAWTERDLLFSLSDFATLSHFQIRFYIMFWALQPSRDNQRDQKDQH